MSTPLSAFLVDDGPPSPDYRHARDITDEVFLKAVETATGVWAREWAMRWDVARVLGGLPIGRDILSSDEVPGVPWKVVLAKFRRCESRGLVKGCACGCRGDFELTDAGRILLGLPRPR